MTHVYIGVGSNQEAEYNLCTCIKALREVLGELQISTIYRSKAIGFEGDDFLNVVIGFETQQSVSELKTLFKQLEQAQGRQADQAKFSSRRLDIDLLLYGEQIDPALKLPHPDILQYPFVLFSLLELQPQLLHPVLQQPLIDLVPQTHLSTVGLTPINLSCL
ncbi:2-amino-4-hydroxy-6-hydroxymethyldihydropteridine diphosphokinase [Thiolinea disciformis]|uniref:2-amino-4-hydroxy-6- hydroxymethyldihydropteridine diphosphokinase n=1 Tax=Thiolinea disciformis TaxID=125614 RepID=UPI00037B203C|nr:2-amino-4-hydroxy-6-hydroxymethyldihydropteridine diphosphokinase [Thiolinea disciformis]